MLRGEAAPCFAAGSILQEDGYLTLSKMNDTMDFLKDLPFLDQDLLDNLDDFDNSFNYDVSLLNCSNESLLDIICDTDISEPCPLEDSCDMPSGEVIDTTALKEDFNRVLDEWQNHLSGMDPQDLVLGTEDQLIPKELEFLIGEPDVEEPVPVIQEVKKQVEPTKVVQVIDCGSSEDEEIDVVSVDEAAVNPFRNVQMQQIETRTGDNAKQRKPPPKLKTIQVLRSISEPMKIPKLLIKKEMDLLGNVQPRLISLLPKTCRKPVTLPKRSILITCPRAKPANKLKPSNPAKVTPPPQPSDEVCMDDHDYCTTSADKPVESPVPQLFNKIPDYISEQLSVICELLPRVEDTTLVAATSDLYNKLPPYVTGLTISTSTEVEVKRDSEEGRKKKEDVNAKPCPRFKDSDWKPTSLSKLFQGKYRSSGSPSSCSSRSRSRSPSQDREGSCSRSGSPSSNGSSCNGSRSRTFNRKQRRSKHDSSSSYERSWKRSKGNSVEEERLQTIDERRIIYVGNIENSITKADLRRRFNRFGPIEEISIHHRDGGNYGFVTFEYRVDAVEAIERGNDNPNLPRYDLNFGGRRQFCRSDYKDLDSMSRRVPMARKNAVYNASSLDFDSLLQATKSLLKAQKKLQT